MDDNVVVVLGGTGTGKSLLAIELARKFKGEVINGDAMQMYKGLNIITNKVTPSERREIPHHLLDCLHVRHGADFTVHEYRDYALNCISDIVRRRKTPIIVGGTHYYLEALMYLDFLNATAENEIPAASHPDEKDYDLLKRVKPEAAKALHPNNLRKIRAALKDNKDLTKPNRPLNPRFTHSIIFWLDTDKNELHGEVLDARVDQMLTEGLIDELQSFVHEYSSNQVATSREKVIEALLHKDETNEQQRRGILQSIGFKEYRPYLCLNDEERKSAAGAKILQSCVEHMKITTRQYAKSQRRWIRARLLSRPKEGALNIYRIDVSPILSARLNKDATQEQQLWHDLVLQRAFATMDHFLNGTESKLRLQPEPVNFPDAADDPSDLKGPPYICETCDQRHFYDSHSFKSHMKSKAHAKRLRGIRKRQQQQTLDTPALKSEKLTETE